jgi:RNA polymerase sigma factor (sigma-70 family)
MKIANDSSNNDDLVLIREALDGNKKSLEKLIKTHQDFIYNVALRLYLDPDDALDATQDVLIKVITHLNSFRAKSQFKTWLYKIVMNHFLNAPKRKWEQPFESLALKSKLAPIVGEEVEISEPEIEEVRVMCSTAMLMCLNRESRLIYIIGEVFGTDHRLGAEMFDLTPANFRVKLHRAKADLLNYVSGKCGIVNPLNPCRCPKKTRMMIQAGMVDKNTLRFNTHFVNKVSDWVAENRETVSDQVQLTMKELFADSPYQIRKELDALVGQIVT